MLKLLIISPSASRAGGGVSEAVRQLSHLLAKRPDVQLRVFALKDGPTGPREEGGWDGIDVTTFPVLGSERFGFSPALLRAVLRERPDVVHVHGIWKFHCLTALLLHRLRDTPYIVTPHGMMEPWIRARSKRLKALVSRLYQDRFLARAFAFHILTEKERGDVEEMVDRPRCALIPNFVESQPTSLPKPIWWRPELEGRDIYLFFGRLHPKKGCVELCDAWERANTENPGFREKSALVFCGPVDGIPDFEGRIEQLSDHFGNVCFAGPQYGDEKPRSFAAATFLCLPSKSEGLPLAVLEGWAAGVPAIMTPECNLPIGFERNAAIRTTTDAEGIAKSLLESYGLSQERRTLLRDSSKSLINDVYSRHIVEREYIALYLKAAATSPNRISPQG